MCPLSSHHRLPKGSRAVTGHPKLRGASMATTSLASMASLEMSSAVLLILYDSKFCFVMFFAWHGLKISEEMKSPQMCH
jgi:hypothetical protein